MSQSSDWKIVEVDLLLKDATILTNDQSMCSELNYSLCVLKAVKFNFTGSYTVGRLTVHRISGIMFNF